MALVGPGTWCVEVYVGWAMDMSSDGQSVSDIAPVICVTYCAAGRYVGWQRTDGVPCGLEGLHGMAETCACKVSSVSSDGYGQAGDSVPCRISSVS